MFSNCFNRLSENVEESPSSTVTVSALNDAYLKDCSRDSIVLPATKQCVAKVVIKLFPSIYLKRNRLKDKSQENVYMNLKMKCDKDEGINEASGIENVFLPNSWTMNTDDNHIIIEIPTEWKCDQIAVTKTLKISGDKFVLYVNNKEVDLFQLGISNKFKWTQNFCNSLHKVMVSLPLCTGHPVSKYVDIPAKGYKCVIWDNIINCESKSKVSCNKCDHIVPLTSYTGACRKCSKNSSVLSKYNTTKVTKNDSVVCNTTEAADASGEPTGKRNKISNGESDEDESDIEEVMKLLWIRIYIQI